MKKKITILIAIALLVCVSLTLVCCKKDGVEEESTESDGGLSFSTLPDGSYGVSGEGLKDDDDVTEVIIPSVHDDIKVTQVPDGAFKDCTHLKKVTVSEGVTTIGKSAFEGCTSLEEIVLPESVTKIGDYAFKGCSALGEVSVPSGVTYMGGASFAGCSSLESIEIPFVGAQSNGKMNAHFGHIFGAASSANQVKSVPKSLGKVAITGGGVIADEAFSGCSGIEMIYLPETIESVSNSAFVGCDKLAFNEYSGGRYLGNAENKYVCLYEVIDKSVESVSVNTGARLMVDEIFSGCASLREVTLPTGLLSVGFEAFKGCVALERIDIPSGVKSIGQSAFLGCSKLSAVTLREGLETIGEGAFNGCSGLLEIVIPSGVTVIGPHTFGGCSSLSKVVLPDGLVRIGNYAFLGCSSLTELELPSSLNFIGVWCFQNCTALKSVDFSNANGWIAGVTAIVSADLSDTSTAAKYLVTNYYSSVWQRK